MKINVSRYEKVTQCFDDLILGRVDAVYVDSVVAAYYTLGSKEYERVWLSPEDEPLGICLAKGSKYFLGCFFIENQSLWECASMKPDESESPSRSIICASEWSRFSPTSAICSSSIRTSDLYGASPPPS